MKEKFIAKNYGGNYIQYLLYEAFLLIQRVLTKYRWRCKNRHNLTSIKNIVDINRISVGNYTCGDLDVRLSNVENSFVKIGSFCCIAAECEFLCLSNHPTDWLLHERVERYYIPGFKSRFVNPMKIKCNIGIKDEKLIHEKTIEKNKKMCHGPIIIDDDVWLGTGVKIMSGVHIGQGAAIGAGAVVTKDIPPYAIAVGIPARVIKYRFPENKIKKLLQIDFNNLSLEKLREIYPETIKEDFDIDYILEKLKE